MAHQDQGRKQKLASNADDLRQAFQWLTTDLCLSSIKLRTDCTWLPLGIVFAGMLWAMSDETTLKDRFRIARKIIMRWFPQQPEPAQSYQAFVKLLVKWTDPLLRALRTHFRRRTKSALAAVWKVGKFLVYACDGSRVDVPRTLSNQERYSPKSRLSREAQKRRRAKRKRSVARRREEQRQNQANVPQIWLTTLWHVGSGLPWEWQTGPSDSSERDHLRQMLPTLPEDALLTADAGFVGFDLWQTILQADCQLLVRVGGNVRLLRKLGYAQECDGLVYLWPDRRRRNACRRWCCG
jgi:hypothetical protein